MFIRFSQFEEDYTISFTGLNQMSRNTECPFSTIHFSKDLHSSLKCPQNKSFLYLLNPKLKKNEMTAKQTNFILN